MLVRDYCYLRFCDILNSKIRDLWTYRDDVSHRMFGGHLDRVLCKYHFKQCLGIQLLVR